MKYKAIIIDDEPKLREVLSIKLTDKCPEIHIVDKCENADSGYDAIVKHHPQIVFLDIAMPGQNGFELLARFDEINFEVIFVTGYNEYGLDALKISAVDYLLKPVKNEDLIASVQKAIIRVNQKEKLEKYENLLHNVTNPGQQSNRIAIPSTNAYEFVQIQDIIRCEGWQKYTKIHLQNGDVIVSSYNLGVFREMLSKYNFFETHKSHIINNAHICKYLKEGIVILSDGSQVPVSRRKKDEFLKEFLG